MKISVNWLKEYTDIKLAIDELVEKIGAQLGEIEEVVDLGKKYKGIKIVKVVSCEKHPNADKLSLCQIDTGSQKVQVVCGAPNVQSDMLAVWIPPGNIVPSTLDKDTLKLEKREIRGEISNGMLASANELDISDDHSGILAVNQGKPGDDFAKIFGLDDFVIDIENKMFTHRPDCFGLLGIAREIAGIQHEPFKSPAWYSGDKTTGKHSDDKDLLVVKNELENQVPRFMVQVVKDVEVKPSPINIQIALKKIGIKPINNVVDVTNYVMYLTGQPLHAYDYDKVKALSGKTPTILTRKPKQGEKVKVLGGKIIEPHPDAIMIATDKQLIGIGGVIGGADTEVDASTKNIALECANFDLYSVRRTSMIHGLFTDAVTRFSKGQSPLQNDRVMAYAVDKIVNESGGKPAKSVYDVKSKLSRLGTIDVNVSFVNERLGLSLSSKDIATLLQNVEFQVNESGKDLSVTPPFWRTDIEIAEDIVEEIGRLYGYDNLPLELPGRKASSAIIDDELKIKQSIRLKLAAFGANELLTYSFIHGNLLKKTNQDSKLAFKIKNALSPDLQYYRLSLTPSLIDHVHANIKGGFDEFALFEIGKVHSDVEIEDDGVPKEFGRIAFVYASKKDLSGSAYYRVLPFLHGLGRDYFDDIKLVKVSSEVDKYAKHKLFSQMVVPFDTDRSAFVYSQDKLIGITGEYKQTVVNNLKLPKECAGFELFLSPFVKSHQQSGYLPLSDYPSTDQDISLRTTYNLDYDKILTELEKALSEHAPEDLNWDAQCIDIFAKDKSHKHTTFRLNFFSYKRTLTSNIISTLLDKTAKDLAESISAERI